MVISGAVCDLEIDFGAEFQVASHVADSGHGYWSPLMHMQGEAMLQGVVMLALIDLVGWALSSGRHKP